VFVSVWPTRHVVVGLVAYGARVTDVLDISTRVCPSQSHVLTVVAPAQQPSTRPCETALLTRAVPANTIAAHLVEIRMDPAEAGSRFAIWIDGRRLRTGLRPGDVSMLTIAIRETTPNAT
jgi:hypothetical protein